LQQLTTGNIACSFVTPVTGVAMVQRHPYRIFIAAIDHRQWILQLCQASNRCGNGSAASIAHIYCSNWPPATLPAGLSGRQQVWQWSSGIHTAYLLQQCTSDNGSPCFGVLATSMAMVQQHPHHIFVCNKKMLRVHSAASIWEIAPLKKKMQSLKIFQVFGPVWHKTYSNSTSIWGWDFQL
jgi:hypothetical protein